ncbi:MAG: hypothetical protein ACRC9X_09325 [Bacteroidales bacterium]
MNKTMNINSTNNPFFVKGVFFCLFRALVSIFASPPPCFMKIGLNHRFSPFAEVLLGFFILAFASACDSVQSIFICAKAVSFAWRIFFSHPVIFLIYALQTLAFRRVA